MFFLEKMIFIEGLGEIPIYWGIPIKALFAIFLGGIIGLDREKKLKPAGVKTQVLICVGATLYTMIGQGLLLPDGSSYDPNRVAAQIVSGVGFLGAGAIIQSRGKITGMTTAATIWLVAAIGLAIGSGKIITAFFFTVTSWGILNLMPSLFKVIRPQKHLLIQVIGECEANLKESIKGYFKRIEEDEYRLDTFVQDNGQNKQINVRARFSTSEVKKFLNYLKGSPGVKFIHVSDVK